VAARLDQLTHKPLLRNSLRLMRAPARAAGLAELQQFLEAGFDTFRSMKGAKEFMGIVQTREQALASALFDADLSGPMAKVGMGTVLAYLPVIADDSAVQRARGRATP
jgi:hypothetical protein